MCKKKYIFIQKKLKSLWILAAFIAVFCLLMVCTISDDLGNPADPGGGNVVVIDSIVTRDTVRSPTIEVGGDALGGIVTDAVYRITAGDTAVVGMRLFSDTARTAGLVSGGSVLVSVTDSSGSYWISNTDSIVTDAQGRANLRFSSDVEGKYVLVFKYANPRNVDMPAEARVEIIVTNNPPRDMIISASPSVLKADGISKSTITVRVMNEFNNPMIGDSIRFRTNLGMITAVGVTDRDGRATAELTSYWRNAVATVTATLVSTGRSEQIGVVFEGVTLTMTTNRNFLRPDGDHTSTITADLRDAAGNSIAKEPIRFTSLYPDVEIFDADTVTDNRGQAECRIVIHSATAGAHARIVATVDGVADTITIEVDTELSSPRMEINPYINNTWIVGETSYFNIYYRDGDGEGVPNARFHASLTVGVMRDEIVFTKELELTNEDGWTHLEMRNPNFSGTGTIRITNLDNRDRRIDTDTFLVHFRGGAVHRIVLAGTPAVISTSPIELEVKNKATITATAYDVNNNRISNIPIAFNLRNGPGGGEHLAPPTAITGIDGRATTEFLSGTLPTPFDEKVEIVASDFHRSIFSATLSFTIAGPPARISIEQSQETINCYPATYGIPVAALVADVNGNPVIDAEVTFSAVVDRRATWELADQRVIMLYDTIPIETPVIDTVLDCRVNEEIVDDVVRRYLVCDTTFGVKMIPGQIVNQTPTYVDIQRLRCDISSDETLIGSDNLPVVLTTRTVQAVNGIANNEIIYGQSAATWGDYCVTMWVESQGRRLVGANGESFPMRIPIDDECK